MRRWLKWLLGILASLIIVIALLFAWSAVKYSNNPLIAHHKISITLPYTAQYEATNLIPMGETIAHNFYGGHPGIDFQWTKSVPLIAVADGTVSSITKADDMGEPVTYLTLSSGEYAIHYKELDAVASGIAVGSTVKQGNVIAYPHCHTNPDGRVGCQVHWEFAYDSFVPTVTFKVDRLCPLTYFTPDALTRINKLWDSVPANDQFKSKFPNICSNIYFGHDQ